MTEVSFKSTLDYFNDELLTPIFYEEKWWLIIRVEYHLVPDIAWTTHLREGDDFVQAFMEGRRGGERYPAIDNRRMVLRKRLGGR
jgi:hypothetical protein